MAAFAARKKATASQYANCPNSERPSPLTQVPAASAVGVCPRRVSVSPLEPNQMPTTAPVGSTGATGGAAGRRSTSVTSGRYTLTLPVAGSRMAASTNAAWSAFAS